MERISHSSCCFTLGLPEAAEALVAEVLAAWGRIDVVIHNAGLSMRGTFAALSNQTVRTMVDANFLSAVWTTRAALPALRQSRGRVLFVSSLAAVRGFPGVSLYSASKMALSALHQSLRAEEGPQGITFSLAMLAFTENDPGKTVLAADGRPFHHQRPWSMTQTQAARILLQTVGRGRNRVVVTLKGRLLDRVQRWFPGLMDRIVAASGGRFHKGEETMP